jgi:hypothetical protein
MQVGRQEEIARRAYEIFISRGSEHGRDLEDWFLAEREVTARPRAPRVTRRATPIAS